MFFWGGEGGFSTEFSEETEIISLSRNNGLVSANEARYVVSEARTDFFIIICNIVPYGAETGTPRKIDWEYLESLNCGAGKG